MNDSGYFNAKINDLIRRYDKGEQMVFSSFLTMEEATDAGSICRKAGVPYFLYGGHSESERKMLVISDLEEEDLLPCFPFVLLEAIGRDLALLTHRDVLGALMALGIRRELLGDIMVQDGKAFLFATDHIKEYLIQNVESIGRQSVQLMEVASDFQLPKPRFEELRLTVASLRADAVVGSLCHCSREQANRLIDGKSVFINHNLLEKKTKEVRAGDRIIVRGSGKWIVDQCGDLTKKGRSVLLCRKYI